MQAVTLILLSLALAFATLNNGGVTLPQWNYAILTVAITGIWHYAIPARRTKPDRLTLIALAALAFFAVIQIIPWRHSTQLTTNTRQLTTISIVPYETQQYLLTLGALILTFLILRDLQAHWREHCWICIWPLLIIAAAEGVLGFIQATSSPTITPARGTYVSYDHYAGLLELVLPLAVMYPIAILARDRSRFESPAAPALKACGILVFATAILIGITFSMSRMGFLATLAALFVCGAAFFRRYVPAALVAIVILLGFIFLPTDPFIARFADLAKSADEISADTRAQIWRDSASLIKTCAPLGCGLGSYESAFYKVKTVAPMNTVDYAHNDYLQYLIELGIFGCAAGLLLVARVLYTTVQRAIHPRNPEQRFLMIGCLGSFTAIAIHSTVDFNLYMPANAMVLAWIAALPAATMASMAKPLRPWRETNVPEPAVLR